MYISKLVFSIGGFENTQLIGFLQNFISDVTTTSLIISENERYGD